MAEKRRLNLSFSMVSPLHREAWNILRAIPAGQRTEAVRRAVCRVREQEGLLEAVRSTIREELRRIEFPSKNEKPRQPQEAGDVDENVLGFLLSLQEEGG